MKKLFSIFLVFVMIVSCLCFTACSKEYKPENAFEDLEGFESYVAEDADILGFWREELPEDSEIEKIEWDFYDTTTLHITETIEGISYSSVSAFNYNEETGKLSYYPLEKRQVITANVEVRGESMTFTDDNGEVLKTFYRVYYNTTLPY